MMLINFWNDLTGKYTITIVSDKFSIMAINQNKNQLQIDSNQLFSDWKILAEKDTPGYFLFEIL